MAKESRRQLPAEGKLLSREDFEYYVLLRAKGKCIFCPAPAVNAHHVLERKLYPETRGYFLGNGAAVCHEHHWGCETTELSVEVVREAAGIVVPVLPPGFDPNLVYDKWGNEVLADGYRIAGPLAHDDGMLKALRKGNVLELLISDT